MNSDNIVTFTSEDTLRFQTILKNKNYTNVIYPVNIQHLTKTNSNKKHITYIGRFDEEVKKTITLANLFEKNKWNLNIISSDFPIDIENKYKYVKFLKSNNPDHAIKLFNDNASALILISSSEGLPISILECLSLEKPIIIRNSFSNAGFLTNNNKNGCLLPSELNISKYESIIKKFDPKKYDKKEIKKFSEEFSENNFIKKWSNILKE